jgi:SAM-dependent methyltransferase
MNNNNDFYLIGDDYSPKQIQQWYKEEEEAYAQLQGIQRDKSDDFKYKDMDVLYGYGKIPNKKYKDVLGLGSAWGFEFLPFIKNMENITIIESSESMMSKQLGSIVPRYLKASMQGDIDLPDNSMDLITCFSVLHHIPNVSFVLSELLRVLRPGGYMLIREPVHSMELGTDNRVGLTKNERGIPAFYIKRIIEQHHGKVMNCSYHFFIHSYLERKLKNEKFLNGKFFLHIDHLLSELFFWNIHYYPKNKMQRIAPQSCYYVIKKQTP